MKDKQWYVDQHRAMWNWIADRIESEQEICIDIPSLKDEYCNLHWNEFGFLPVDGCFACEYKSVSGKHLCRDSCLFSWGESHKFVHCLDGYYEGLNRCRSWREQAALARKIANLPVREDV